MASQFDIAANAAHMLTMVEENVRWIIAPESRNKDNSWAIEGVPMQDVVDVVHKALSSPGAPPFVQSLNNVITEIESTERAPDGMEWASVNEAVAHIVKSAVEDQVLLGRSNVKLNAFQTDILPHILNSTQHLVVSAPSGSGKTMAFDFLIVAWRRDVQRAIDEEGACLSDFAVVITVPGRDLAEEHYAHFKRTFPDLSVVRFIADDDYATTDYANIIVATTAKAHLAFVRNRAVAQRVTLLIIDESHKLHDKLTGPLIEGILMAAGLINNEDESGKVRVVLMSGTMYNIVNVQQYVRVALGSEDVTMLSYGLDYRPVPLDIAVATGSATDVKPYQGVTEKTLSPSELRCLLARKLRQSYGNQKALMFSAGRSQADKMSKYMTNKIGAPPHTRPFNECRLATCSQTTRDTIAYMKRNRSCKRTKAMLKGVPAHHAGLLPRERLAVTELMTSGTVKVISCTTTLSHGINVGAETVFIIGTVMKRTAGNDEHYTVMDVMQMLGRAGRPQRLEEMNQVRARGVIIAESPEIADKYYTSISNGDGTTIESQLDKADALSVFITDVIYMLAVRQNCRSVVHVKIGLGAIYEQIYKSYFAFCLRNRVGRHNIFSDSMTTDELYETVYQYICDAMLDALHKCVDVGQLVVTNLSRSGVVSLTTVGQIATECRLSPDSTHVLNNAASPPFDDEVNKAIYYALANTDDCQALLRGGDGDEEDSSTAAIRDLMAEQFVFVVPNDEELASGTGVLVVLLQVMIARQRLCDPTLRERAEDLCSVVPRLLVGLKRLAEVNGNWEMATMTEALQSMFKHYVVPMYS